MKEWLISDIHAGHSVCYFDPHGHDTDDILQFIPRARRKDVLIFDPSQFAVPWNPLDAENIPMTASMFVNTFRSVWKYSEIATPRMDGVVYNTLVALMEARHSLFGMYLMLVSRDYRFHVLDAVLDPVVVQYWHQFEMLDKKQQDLQIESTLNKIQILMVDPRVRAIAGTVSRLCLKDIVKDKILFVRLPQGELGLEKTAMLGSLLLTQLHQALLARDPSVPFCLYLDEVHTWAPDPIAEMLSGIRKFNVTITAVHQYLGQLDAKLRDSLNANASQFAFRVSMDDRDGLPKLGEQEIQPYELPSYTLWAFDGVTPRMVTTSPLSFTPYEASYRQIRSNILRNYVAPATRENDALMTRYC
jgi:hypothetical protein